MPETIKYYEGFYSKYAWKTYSRRNKTIIYEGSIKDMPESLDLKRGTIAEAHKFCIIFTESREDTIHG